jgi:hypothetical protein
MTAEDITNQFKHVPHEIERRKQFISRMERKLISKQRRNTRHRYIPRNWFPTGSSSSTGKNETELLGDMFKDS